MVRMSSAPRGGGGYGGLLGMTSSSGGGGSSGQYRSSYSKQGSSSSSYLGIVVGLSAMSIFVIFVIYYLISSPVKFDEAEAEALTKFIVRSLGDALPDPPPNSAAVSDGGDNSKNDPKSGPVFVFGFSETDDNVASTAAGISRAYSDLVTAGHSSSNIKVLLFDVLNDGSPSDTLEHHVPNYSGSKKLLRLIRSGTTRSSSGHNQQHFMNLPHPPTYPDDFEVHPWKHSTLHTLREAKAAVTACKAAGAAALVIVAPSFHLPRALLTTLSVAAQYDKHLKIYAYVGAHLRWDENVAHTAHTQDLVVGDREALLDSEMQRMFLYHQKGDLMEPSDALEALRRRDRRTAMVQEALGK